ncbi:EAL domain-containing protein [Thiomicrospira sp. R3]|uniref:two-component system response regulator n=1 Tax=Thiomicrospira sp. R3 TaxID=3035472 RepID=UPI00259B31CC|nr:EAL domain-containing protein [Thiomicrospira sp. R3]WFE69674.1 EAL domain-containing protein [Thiomicrospira sp. R3]
MDQQPTHILVVEDDPITRITLSKVLEKSGFSVILAENGRIGLNKFIKHSPQLVLMDAMMPEMDGYETITAIRNYEKDRAVPILMLTSLDDLESVDHAFEVGATDFITKPINWSLLSQRVRYAIRTSQIEDDLRRSKAQLAYAQKLAKLGYWEWDAVHDNVSGSPSAFQLFNLPHQTNINMERFLSNVVPQDLLLLHQTFSEAARGQSHIEINFRVQATNNLISHIECLGEVYYDEQDVMQRVVGSVQDITRLHRAESLIDYQTRHDNLTELANRTFFTEELVKHCQQCVSCLSAVVIFDIDRFKIINDNLGQNHGDELLAALALRIRLITREGDFIARLGSDEFAILIRTYKNTNELNQLVHRIYQDLKQSFMIKDQELFLTYSMGIAIFPDDASDAETILQKANIARGQAKQTGGNQALFYRAEMNAEAKQQLLLENDLRKALKQNQIKVFFQPQVDAQTLLPVGAEALVRWMHPEIGMVSPVIFIPLAESTGLIVEIGRYVMEESIRQLEAWHADGFTDMRVGVNLSARQFNLTNLLLDVETLLSSTKIDPKYLDLEITESFAMSNAEHNISVLRSLKAMGVSISIDDFGTGYSSLAYLHKFPIDTIKIDRSFILNLTSKEGQSIARTIIAMANALDLEVIAEGIEDDTQVQFLQEKNCNILQGFRFGKPMSAQDFMAYLRQFKKPIGAAQ